MHGLQANLALLDSVKRGDREAVGWLLAAGADPGVRDLLDGFSTLHFAARAGHLEIVRLLIEYGAPIGDRQNVLLESPLAAAAGAGQTEVVQFLLAQGADPDEIRSRGEVPGEGGGQVPCPPEEGVTGPADIPAGPTTPEARPPEPAWVVPLVEFYRRCGYIRRPIRELWEKYPDEHEVWEVRFVLDTKAQLQPLRWLLEQGGFQPGEPVRKYRRHTQSVHGRQAVERLSALVRQQRT